jgi:putative spermidine/putrescine transport system permease protein
MTSLPRRRNRATNTWGYLLVAPAVAVLVIAFLYPVLRMIVTSLLAEDTNAFSLERYTELLRDPYYLKIIWRTIYIALGTTALTLVLAFPVALYMRQLKGRARAFLSIVLLSPLLISVVVRTLGWVLLLSPTGLVNKVTTGAGLGTIHILNTQAAVILGMVHVYFGYMTLSLMISILRIDENLLLAAADLGAKRYQILRHVILPMSMPGIRAGSMLVFALAASAYITPSLLGSGREPLLAQRVYDSALQYADFPLAATFATILLVVILVGMAVIGLVTRTPSERRGGKVAQ